MSLAEAWALFSVASAVLVVHAATFLPALSDDALISLRYVRRFLDGAGLTWTQGEAVEGYSNLLWMLLVAAGGALGFDLIATTRFLGFACSLATIAAVVWTHKRLAAPRAHTCVALAALVAAGPIAAWTVGGLETPLVAALIAWAIALTLPLVDRDEIRWRDAYAPAAMLGLACLTRPDGVLFTITIAVALIGVRWGSRDRLGGALRLAIIPVALCIAQVAFRVAYYGEWIPNTGLAKIHPSLAELFRGAKYVWRGVLATLPLSVIAALAAGAALRCRSDRRGVLLLAIVAATWACYVAAVGGDVFPAWRQCAPLCVLMSFALLLGLGHLVPRTRVTSFVLGVACVAFVFVQIRNSEVQRARDETWAWDGESVGVMLARGFADDRPTIAVDAAGAVPYWSNFPALDMLGLNDRHIARSRPQVTKSSIIGHEIGDGAYVLSRRPDLVIFGPPRGSLQGVFVSGIEMMGMSEFRERYSATRFVTRTPAEVESVIWVDRTSDRIGVRASGDEVVVPCYLLGRDGSARIELDASGAFFTELCSDRATTWFDARLPLGTWSVDEPLGALVRFVRNGRPCGPAQPVPAQIAQVDENPVDVELSAVDDRGLRIRELRLRRR